MKDFTDEMYISSVVCMMCNMYSHTDESDCAKCNSKSMQEYKSMFEMSVN
jgi:ribosomal protein L40E